VSPGFYVAIGDKSSSERAERHLVRLYLSLGPDRAVWFVSRVTQALNPRVPFRLKVINHPDRFDRRDAVILYVHRKDYDEAGELIEALYPQLGIGADAPVPALTKRLLPGVGLAHEPVDGGSYGFHRCGLVADGLIHAYERSVKSLGDRVDAV